MKGVLIENKSSEHLTIGKEYEIYLLIEHSPYDFFEDRYMMIANDDGTLIYINKESFEIL